MVRICSTSKSVHNNMDLFLFYLSLDNKSLLVLMSQAIKELIDIFCFFSYKRSASLSQFVIHRGLIISTMQAVFCSVFYFASIALFPGFLMVG